MSAFHQRLADALQTHASPGNLAAEIAKHGSMELEFYAPAVTDPQQPHDRDELYFVARGHGVLTVENEEFRFQTGDALFVPAHAVHRFTSFSSDFATWVVFYGPKGGEPEAP
jgi:mannose-6-phosphate isomerase-like protein (cupin superfamily)